MSSRAVRRAAALGAALALTVALMVAYASSALAAGVTATFTKTQDWGSGFQGQYVVTNDTTITLSSWRVEFDLLPTQRVNSVWDAVLTSSDSNHYVIDNAHWNGTLAPGASVTFGFVGAYSGTWRDPANCTVNGAACDGGGGGGGDTTPPTAPGNLRVTATTSSSVSLDWDAASDNIGIADYQVLQGGSVVGTTTTTAFTAGGLPASSTFTFTVRARDPAGNVGPGASVTATTDPDGGGGGGPPGDFGVAPFADMLLFPTFDLSASRDATGIAEYNLAFVISQANQCDAAWGGVIDVGDGFLQDQITELRAAGGDVKVSFGGAAGLELGQACGSVSALAAQYQRTIDAYDFDYVDFDIEGAAVADPVSVQRRSQAMAQLQATARARGEQLRISLTLPVLPTGLVASGVEIVRSARDAGVDLTMVNIMAMDYGDGVAPDPDGRMGEFAIQAAQSTHDQLASLFPGRSDSELWAMVGVTPMIGQNDVRSEVFNEEDARQLVSFAEQVNLGMLSFWSSTRDKACSQGNGPPARPNCSGVSQSPFAFSRIFATYG